MRVAMFPHPDPLIFLIFLIGIPAGVKWYLGFLFNLKFFPSVRG